MSGMDCIIIKNLRTRCLVGIREDERKNPQDIIINIRLWADLSKPCKSDNINDTVDYSNLKKEILLFVEQSSFFLIEKLAEQIAGLCLAKKGVLKAKVKVEKPTALRFADSVAVEIIRRNE